MRACCGVSHCPIIHLTKLLNSLQPSVGLHAQPPPLPSPVRRTQVPYRVINETLSDGTTRIAPPDTQYGCALVRRTGNVLTWWDGDNGASADGTCPRWEAPGSTDPPLLTSTARGKGRPWRSNPRLAELLTHRSGLQSWQVLIVRGLQYTSVVPLCHRCALVLVIDGLAPQGCAASPYRHTP